MTESEIQHVLVLGAGTAGQQIALQCAAHGYRVAVFDNAAEALHHAAARHHELLEQLRTDGVFSELQVRNARDSIAYTTDAVEAARRADLISESVPESLRVKRDVFRRFDGLCSSHTIFTTNTSYHLPSDMAQASGRPDRFAALHFHIPVWYANAVDIMPHEGTASETTRKLTRFARGIGQIPIVLRKENHGYIFNEMLRDWLMAALSLAEKGIASPHDIDRAWIAVTKMKSGPFGVLDGIGLETVYQIASYWSLLRGDQQARKNASYLKHMIDAGRTGEKCGQGFYSHPHPLYQRPEFLGVKDAAPPAPAPPRASRVALDLVEAPTDPRVRHPLRLNGPVWIHGDISMATELAGRIRDLGGEAVLLPQFDSLERAESWLATQSPQASSTHLFLLSARAAAAQSDWDADRWSARYEQGILVPYRICQHWYQRLFEAKRLYASTLVAATSLGGDFGLGGQIPAPEGGALCGLLKAAFVESAGQDRIGTQVKIVDLPADTDPEIAVERLLSETAAAQAAVLDGSREEAIRRFSGIEVSWMGNQRRAIRCRIEPAHPEPGALQDVFRRDSVWLLTGGARGITAQIARCLGSRFDVRLQLVGRTRVPDDDYSQLSEAELAAFKQQVLQDAFHGPRLPMDVWNQVARGVEVQKTLADLANLGAKVAYHICDMDNRAEVERLVQLIRANEGPIEGIIHGAGVEITKRFDKKAMAEVRNTLGGKVNGARWLMELTREDPLRYFVAFGSLSGRFGGAGQTDYSLANDLLAKQVGWFRQQRPDCRSVLIHWPGWSDVGMAARPESRRALQQSGHQLLEIREGLDHLLDELAMDAPRAEVLVVRQEQLPPEIRADR